MNKNKKAQKVESKKTEFNAKSYEKSGLMKTKLWRLKKPSIFLILMAQEKSIPMN